MQLYVVPCYVVSAEIAEAMAVPIENPADREVRGVIRFLHADEILDYLSEDASSRMELFCCTTTHVHRLPGRHKPCCVNNSKGHLRASNAKSGPDTVGIFSVSKNEAAPCW